MTLIRVSQIGLVNAPPGDVYRFIADYHRHHLNFLPPNFSNVIVDSGGVGAGTELSFNLRLGGQTRRSRVRIDEPHPGSVLSEIDVDTGAVTTFDVSPSGDVSRVHIETTWEARGVRGMIERLFAPRMLQRLYIDELRRLDEYARTQLTSV